MAVCAPKLTESEPEEPEEAERMVRLLDHVVSKEGGTEEDEEAAREIQSLERFLLAESTRGRDARSNGKRERGAKDGEVAKTLDEVRIRIDRTAPRSSWLLNSESSFADDSLLLSPAPRLHASTQVDKLVRRSLSKSVEVLDGLALFNKLRASVLLPTGVETLDALLGGGLREGQVTEFFGASPSGKTQVCHCVAACAAWLDFQVVYLTSNGSFSAERLVKLSPHVMSHFNLTDAEGVDGISKILANVSVSQVSDTISTIALIQGMVESFGLLVKHNKRIPKVVIVDSPSLYLYRDLSTNMQFGRFLMTLLSSSLKALATRFSVAVLVTNHEVRPWFLQSQPGDGRGDREECRPGLGQLWTPQVNVRIHLKMFRLGLNQIHGGEEGEEGAGKQAVVCRAVLTKASTTSCGREVWMRVGENRIEGLDNPGLEQQDLFQGGALQDISVWR